MCIRDRDVYSWLDISDRSAAGPILRVVFLIFGATICLIVPSLGPGRFVVCGAVMAIVPATWWVELKLPPSKVDVVLSIGQGAIGLIVASAIPILYVPSILFVVASTVTASTAMGIRGRLWLLPLLVGFAPIGFYHSIQLWPVTVVAALFGFFSVSEYVAWLAVRQEVAELRLNLAAFGSKGVFWEFDVTSVEFNKVGALPKNCST